MKPPPKNQKQIVTAPTRERSSEPDRTKSRHTRLIGIGVYCDQLRSLAKSEGMDNTAVKYVSDMLIDMKCRDPLEEILVVQALWTHIRLANLSVLANQQTSRDNLKVLHDAADRAANTFRKQLLALGEYRRPPRTEAFVAIKQANVAQQQVISNGQNQNITESIPSNELGLCPATALPSHAHGAGCPPTVGGAQQAVAVQHRPQDGGGQGSIGKERDEAR